MKGKGHFQGKTLQKGHFPFIAWENRMSQGVATRGSLINVPFSLGVWICRAFLEGGDLNPGEQHSRDTRDDGTVMLCTLRHAIVAQILVVS